MNEIYLTRLKWETETVFKQLNAPFAVLCAYEGILYS